MAVVAEENQVIAACSSLLVAVSHCLAVATFSCH